MPTPDPPAIENTKFQTQKVHTVDIFKKQMFHKKNITTIFVKAFRRFTRKHEQKTA